jgi:hypothetical protein
MTTHDTINIAPTASTVVSLYESHRLRPLDSTTAIAVLAEQQGLGDIPIDRLRVRLFVEPSVAELAIGE